MSIYNSFSSIDVDYTLKKFQYTEHVTKHYKLKRMFILAITSVKASISERSERYIKHTYNTHRYKRRLIVTSQNIKLKDDFKLPSEVERSLDVTAGNKRR